MDVVGCEVVEIRRMTSEEAEREGWDDRPIHHRPEVLVLDDGTLVYPSRDPEGNGPGSLFGWDTEADRPVAFAPEQEGAAAAGGGD